MPPGGWLLWFSHLDSNSGRLDCRPRRRPLTPGLLQALNRRLLLLLQLQDGGGILAAFSPPLAAAAAVNQALIAAPAQTRRGG